MERLIPLGKGTVCSPGMLSTQMENPAVFSMLKSLGIGEYIFVYSAGIAYTYKVVVQCSCAAQLMPVL